MLLRYSLKLDADARLVEAAVSKAIDSGALPADLARPGAAPATTRAAGAAVSGMRFSGALEARAEIRDQIRGILDPHRHPQ